jgi:hypothetical protein
MQFNEKDRGSIETGKLGDLVVIDRDYFSCPEDEIRQIRPVMTIINGKIVYSVSHTSASVGRRMLQSQHPGMPTNANHESGVTAYARGAAQERLF